MFDLQLQSADGSDTQAGQAWPSTGQMLTISLACHGEGTVAAAVETEAAPTGHCHDLTTRFPAVRGRTRRNEPIEAQCAYPMKRKRSRDVRYRCKELTPSRTDEEWWLS